MISDRRHELASADDTSNESAAGANETGMRLGQNPGRNADEAVCCRAWSQERRMRDSNSRGVAPNTLSKSVGVRSRQVSAVCDLELRPGPVLCGRSPNCGE